MSYDCKLCTLNKHVPFLMDDSKRWKAYFYENGDPCKYNLFAGSNIIPDGDPVSPNGTGMAGGNWAFLTTLSKCDSKYRQNLNSGLCGIDKYLNQGVGVTANAQSSKLSLIGTNGSSISKFNVKDIGLGGIQEWSLPKYLEPNKETWGSILGHQKIYPELSPPYIRGPRLGIRTAHIFLGQCDTCVDSCCNCKLSCAEGISPPISNNDGEKIKRSPCEMPCIDPYSSSIGKPLGFEDICFCVAPTPVPNIDYVLFLNTIAKNDIFGGNNIGFTNIIKTYRPNHEDKNAILDLWNIDMHPTIIRQTTNDSIHKYIYTCDSDSWNLPVVNVTFYAAKWYVKWMRSNFVNPFKFSKLELDTDPTKINCDDAVLELIDADYKWNYEPSVIIP